MQLKLKRSQTTTGMLSKTAVFCLDARAELTSEESHNVKKYGLGKEVVYTSEAAKKHLDAIQQNAPGVLRLAMHVARAKMSLVITIDSLTKGQHIEGKDLTEIMGAEEALMEACQNIKAYLTTAVTFDGREQVLEF